MVEQLIEEFLTSFVKIASTNICRMTMKIARNFKQNYYRTETVQTTQQKHTIDTDSIEALYSVVHFDNDVGTVMQYSSQFS